MERAGPAWRPQFQRERCARGAPAWPELHRAVPPGAPGAALRSPGAGEGGGGDKACKGFVGARVVLGQDGLARSAKGEAEVVDPCGDQGPAHDAADHEGGKRDAKRHAEAQPAADDALVACHQK